LSPITLLLIAVGLAMDAFAAAVAISIALRTVTPRQVFRLAFHLGLFQALMPIVGWLAGSTLGAAIATWDHWLAFGLLTLVGLKAIGTALGSPSREGPRNDPTRGLTLVAIAVATSLDALAVGITLAMLEVRIWYPALAIGVVTCLLTASGMALGSRLGVRWGRGAEILGGLILIGVGVKILVQHLTAG